MKLTELVELMELMEYSFRLKAIQLILSIQLIPSILNSKAMKKETTYLQHVRNKNIIRIILNNQSRILNTKRRIYTRKTRKLTKQEILFMKESGDYKELTFEKVMKIL